MPRRPNVPCAGGCGGMCWRDYSQPDPKPLCRECRRTRRQRICEQCGEEFSRYLDARFPPRFCSQVCWGLAQRLYEHPRAASKASTRARKLKHRETWDGVTDQQIYERDGWKCQIRGCGKPIDPLLAWPDPGSASVDHIVPLSRGGSDTAPNKRAAHFRCNVVRGNRMHENDELIITPVLAPIGVLPLPKRTEPKKRCLSCGKRMDVRAKADTCKACRSATRELLRQQILECRKQGMIWVDIAVRFGLSGSGAAHNIAYPPWGQPEKPAPKLELPKLKKQEPETEPWWLRNQSAQTVRFMEELAGSVAPAPARKEPDPDDPLWWTTVRPG